MFERSLNNLRERPREERTAIAAWVSISVVLILLICWLIYFLHSIQNTPAPVPESVATSTDQNGLQQAQQDSGSSTQFVETQGSLQLQQIATSTYSQ